MLAGRLPATVGRRSWVDRVRAWRDRLLMSSRFQNQAAAFPLTRPIARRRARRLFDLCAGFVYSQVLLACVRLSVLERLAEGPATAEQLAHDLGLSLHAVERLLPAAASLGLVARRGPDRYALGELGASALGNPGVLAMISHHDMLYRDLADPVALLCGQPSSTDLGSFWAYTRTGQPAALSDNQVADYTELMAASQAFIAGEVLDCYEIGGHRILLDVGGGDGSFLVTAAQRAPRTELWLFDLPAVAARAERRLSAANLQDRSRVFAGDLHRDALPQGADVVTLLRVVHDHDEHAALAILRNVRAALPVGGVLLLAEPMAGTPGAQPVGDAYFAFYLLAMGQGRARTAEELERLLLRAGFTRIRRRRTKLPMLVSVLEAIVPQNRM